MANQLFQQLNQQTARPKQVSIQDIMQEVNQSGMSAKDLFYKKITETGQNPDNIISQAMKFMSNMR